MRRKMIVLSLLWIPGMLLPSTAVAAPGVCGTPGDVLIVLDRSGSMTSWGKWASAKQAVTKLTTTYNNAIHFGLMLFPGPGGICGKGIIDVPNQPNAKGKIAYALNKSSPSGNTPMAASLAFAKNYVKGSKKKNRYVLLITDGAPNCTPTNPLPEVNAMRGMGIKTFVVGFGLGVDANQLNALASAGGTAKSGFTKYYQANNTADLSKVLATIGGLVSCCGNGKRESWEKCEKSLPMSAGGCPKSASQCPYKKCAYAVLSGSECDVSCTYLPVTQPKSGDGCCPAGANYNNDKDCKVSCGNGILEGGESCDPKITSGAGKCKSAEDCNDNNLCTKDEVVGPACHRKCQFTPYSSSPTVKDGCCPAGLSSADDADCPPPCGPDQTTGCVNPCKGITCPSGMCCSYGKCKPCSGSGSGGSGSGSGSGSGGSGGSGSGWTSSYSDGGISEGYDPDSSIAGGCSCEVGSAADAGLLPLALLCLLWAARRRQ